MKIQRIMTRFAYCSLLFFLIFNITSCDFQQSQVEQPALSDLAFSKSFKPAGFTSEDRIARVRSLAPDLEKIFEEHAADRKIPGIAYGIVVDDSLVISSALGLMNLETQQDASITSCFRIASMTKSFTAMAIMKLRDEGKLSLEDPVAQYIPSMANLEYLTSDAPIIDIQNLLTMTAGFPEDNPWGDRQLDESDQMLMDMMQKGVSFSNVPSFQYEYSNTGFALLGNIVSRISGMPYQDYIREEILRPLGMNDTYWEYSRISDDQLVLGYRWEDEQWKDEPILHDGSFGAMGGLITTIEDFSKYVSYHLSAWPPRSEPDNGPVLRKSLREMHTPQFTRLFAQATDYNGTSCPSMSGYGYGLGVIKDCNGITRVRHGGALPGYGSSYIFYPDYGIGIMAFGNLTYTGPLPSGKIEKLLFESIDLQPRQLPVSDILEKRSNQVLLLIQNWESNIETEILAENFYLDKSRAHRLAEINEIMAQAGSIQSIEEIKPLNQLRGSFIMKCEKDDVRVFFTLSPEKDPKVQRLNVSLLYN